MAGYDSEQFSLDLLQVDERLRQVIQAVYIDYYYSDDDEDGNNDGGFIDFTGDVNLENDTKALGRIPNEPIQIIDPKNNDSITTDESFDDAIQTAIRFKRDIILENRAEKPEIQAEQSQGNANEVFDRSLDRKDLGQDEIGSTGEITEQEGKGIEADSFKNQNIELEDDEADNNESAGGNETLTVEGFDELSFTENDGADTEALDSFASEGTLFFNSLSGNNVVDVNTGILTAPNWNGGQLDPEIIRTLQSGLTISEFERQSSGNLNWEYNVEGVDLNFLSEEESIKFSYFVEVTDSEGNSATDTLTIFINGTNDSPKITAENSNIENRVVEGEQQSASGVLNANDIDNNTMIWSVEGSNQGQYGSHKHR